MRLKTTQQQKQAGFMDQILFVAMLITIVLGIAILVYGADFFLHKNCSQIMMVINGTTKDNCGQTHQKPTPQEKQNYDFTGKSSEEIKKALQNNSANYHFTLEVGYPEDSEPYAYFENFDQKGEDIELIREFVGYLNKLAQTQQDKDASNKASVALTWNKFRASDRLNKFMHTNNHDIRVGAISELPDRCNGSSAMICSKIYNTDYSKIIVRKEFANENNIKDFCSEGLKKLSLIILSNAVSASNSGKVSSMYSTNCRPFIEYSVNPRAKQTREEIFKLLLTAGERLFFIADHKLQEAYKAKYDKNDELVILGDPTNKEEHVALFPNTHAGLRDIFNEFLDIRKKSP